MRNPDNSFASPGAPALQIPCDEDDRLSVLATYGLEELQDDDTFNRVVAFAAKLCDVPIALVSIVERERQLFLARQGVDETETPRSTSFCAHAMLGTEPMEVPDAQEDERFRDFSLVTGPPHIRFYAGAPLLSDEGVPLGALCVIDTEPRPNGLTPLQREGLMILAETVMRRLHGQRITLRSARDLEHSERNLYLLADSLPDMIWSADAEGVIDYGNRKWHAYTGSDTIGTGELIHPDDRERAAAEWREAVKKGAVYESRVRLRRNDGAYRWVLARAVPVRDAEGNVERWFGSNTDIDETQQLSETRELVARELSHRIKNIFAVIGGLISLTARGTTDVGEYARELAAKVRALGRAHDFVRPVDGESTETLHGLIQVLMAPYTAEGRTAVAQEGEDIAIGPRAATPLALIVHELATNAAKYGALSQPEGSVTVKIESDGQEAVLLWREQGGPPAAEPKGTGFGSRLVETSVTKQLGGSIEWDWRETGLCVRIAMPAAGVQS